MLQSQGLLIFISLLQPTNFFHFVSLNNNFTLQILIHSLLLLLKHLYKFITIQIFHFYTVPQDQLAFTHILFQLFLFIILFPLTLTTSAMPSSFSKHLCQPKKHFS